MSHHHEAVASHHRRKKASPVTKVVSEQPMPSPVSDARNPMCPSSRAPRPPQLIDSCCIFRHAQPGFEEAAQKNFDIG